MSIVSGVVNDATGDLIRRAIQSEVEKIVREESEVAAKRVEASVRGSVGQIAAKVLERFTFERHGSELRIIVDFENTKK